MGRMKEMFMKQIEEQMFRMESQGDEDYDYEQYLKAESEIQREIERMNNEMTPAFSSADIEEIINRTFSNFQISDRLKGEIIGMIMTELNNLKNLRNGNTN